MTITDAEGLSITSSVNVAVKQKVTAIKVTPSVSTVQIRKTLQLLATAIDQFGETLTAKPTMTWSLSGRGTVNSKGLFTASSIPGGPYTIYATYGTIRGYAKVTVVR